MADTKLLAQKMFLALGSCDLEHILSMANPFFTATEHARRGKKADLSFIMSRENVWRLYSSVENNKKETDLF